MDELIGFGRRLAARGDAGLAELLDAFLEIGRSGKAWSRAEVVGALAGPAGALVESVRPTIRFLGDGMAPCLCETVSGRGRTLRSALRQRRAEGWGVLFHQGTPAADDPR